VASCLASLDPRAPSGSDPQHSVCLSNWYLSSPDDGLFRQDTAWHNCRYARGPELTMDQPSSARYAL
jgi:hypothetical protein